MENICQGNKIVLNKKYIFKHIFGDKNKTIHYYEKKKKYMRNVTTKHEFKP